MSALAAPRHVSQPLMRVVVPMLGAPPPPPPPLHRVKNTIKCQTEFCKLPLGQITTTGRYLPLHARSESYTLNGLSMLDLKCPACGTVRTVRVH